MNDLRCPWCETDLILHLVSDEQTCPECGTTWSYEEEQRSRCRSLPEQALQASTCKAPRGCGASALRA